MHLHVLLNTHTHTLTDVWCCEDRGVSAGEGWAAAAVLGGAGGAAETDEDSVGLPEPPAASRVSSLRLVMNSGFHFPRRRRSCCSACFWRSDYHFLSTNQQKLLQPHEIQSYHRTIAAGSLFISILFFLLPFTLCCFSHSPTFSSFRSWKLWLL